MKEPLNDQRDPVPDNKEGIDQEHNPYNVKKGKDFI